MDSLNAAETVELKPSANKRADTCLCGRHKTPGAPLCRKCWARLPEDLQSACRVDYAGTFPAIVKWHNANLDAQAETIEAAHAPQQPEPASPAQSLIMIALTEAQMDRVWRDSSLEMKVVAMRAMFAAVA